MIGNTVSTKIREKLLSLSLTLFQRRPMEKLVNGLHVRYDLNQMQKFEAVLNRIGLSFRQFFSILDFGCGSGRLTRYLFALAPEAQVFGCDVSARSIEECRRKYPHGHFALNDWRPPLGFEGNQFDLVFSYSVFTHLSEHNHKDWLKELSRILKPHGVMVHTTHSYACLTRMAMFSPDALTKYDLCATVDDFIKSAKGYHYVINDKALPEYGLAIISKEYVLDMWSRYSGLRIVEYAEGAIEAYPEGCQDIVIMAKDRA